MTNIRGMHCTRGLLRRLEERTLEMQVQKRQQIAQTLKATRERRQQQIPKVYELKVDTSRLSKTTRAYLALLFLQAKWFYNYVLSQPDAFQVDTTVKTVPVKVGDQFEERALTHLSSQMKQGLVTQIQNSIKALAELKARGHKVGKLKFKRRVRTIPLKQHKNTYTLVRKKHSPSNGWFHLQKLPTKLQVRGFKQIPSNTEFANAYFFTRHGDYFLKVVIFLPKPKSSSNQAHQAIGLDMGLKHQLTFSNGVKVNYRIAVPHRLQKLYQRWSRTQPGSQNREKFRLQLEKAFLSLTHIKTDIRNKLVAYLKTHYQIVCFQDENIKAWQRIWGRKMYDTSLGGLMSILKERIPTPIEVERFFASTQLCSQCGARQSISLADRTYACPTCGLLQDRDVNSAINILLEGLAHYGGTGRTDINMPVETSTTTVAMVQYFATIPYVTASRVVEAGSTPR